MIDTSAEGDNIEQLVHASLDMENCTYCSSWNGGLVSSNKLFMVIICTIYQYIYLRDSLFLTYLFHYVP